jgi:hypothetical protein
MRRILRMLVILAVLAPGVEGQQPAPALPCQDCCPEPPCYPPPPPEYPVRVAIYYPWWDGVRPPGTRCSLSNPNLVAAPDGRCPKWSEIRNFWFHPDFDANGVFDWRPWPEKTSSVDLYDDQNIEVVMTQINRMARAGISGLVASWWNLGDETDAKLQGVIFDALEQQRYPLVDGTFYYESKGHNDQGGWYDNAFFRLKDLWERHRTRVLVTGDGRPVVFVYAPWYTGSSNNCATFRWWKERVLDPFERDFGVRPFLVADFHDDALTNCAAYHNKGDWGWHRYGPPSGSYYTERWAYGFRNTQTLSPGFTRECWPQREYGPVECDPRRRETEYETPRNPQAFEAAATMAQSYRKRARYFQIITTCNEWLEFTAVEPAVEWWSSSGLGTYLDILAAHPVP